MRVFLGLVVGALLVAALDVDGQGQGLPATALEGFASRPATIVAWATPIGQLDSTASRAILTAVALQDRESLSIRRGVRMDLVHLQPPDCPGTPRFPSLCTQANAALL